MLELDQQSGLLLCMDACEGVEDFCTQLLSSFELSSSETSCGPAITHDEKLGGRERKLGVTDGRFEEPLLPLLDSSWSPEPTLSLDAMHEDHDIHSSPLPSASTSSLQSQQTNGGGGPSLSSPVEAIEVGRDAFFDCGDTVEIQAADWHVAAEDWPSLDLNALSEFLDALPEIPLGDVSLEELPVAVQPLPGATGLAAPQDNVQHPHTHAFTANAHLTLVQSDDVTPPTPNASAGMARPPRAATTIAGVHEGRESPLNAAQAPAAPPSCAPTRGSSIVAASLSSAPPYPMACQSHPDGRRHPASAAPCAPSPCPLPTSHETEASCLPSLLPPPSAAQALRAAATAAVAAASASAAARSPALSGGDSAEGGQKQQLSGKTVKTQEGSAPSTGRRRGGKQTPPAQSLSAGGISADTGAVGGKASATLRDGKVGRWGKERERAKQKAGSRWPLAKAIREAREGGDTDGGAGARSRQDKMQERHQPEISSDESGSQGAVSSPDADVAPWESSNHVVVEAVTGAAAACNNLAPWPAVLPGTMTTSVAPVLSEAGVHIEYEGVPRVTVSQGGAIAGCPSVPTSLAAAVPAAAAAAAAEAAAGEEGCVNIQAGETGVGRSSSSGSSSRQASGAKKTEANSRCLRETRSHRATQGRPEPEMEGFNNALQAEEHDEGVSGSEDSEQHREEEEGQDGQQVHHLSQQLDQQQPNEQQGNQQLLHASQEEGKTEPALQKRELRLQRNRQSALLSRQRRKSYVSELEGKCSSLMSAVAHLRQALAVTAMENGALRDQLMRLQAVGIMPVAGAAPGVVPLSAMGGGSNGSASVPGAAAVVAAASLPPPSSPSQVSGQSDDQEAAGDTREMAGEEEFVRKTGGRGLKRSESDMQEGAERATGSATGGTQRGGECESGVKRRKASAAAVAAAGAATSSVVAEPAALESDSLPSESLPWPSTSVRSSSSFSSSIAFLLLILTLSLTTFYLGPSPVLLILPLLCSILLFRACLPRSLPLPLAWQHGPCQRFPSLPQSMHQLVDRGGLTHSSQGSKDCQKFQDVAVPWSSVLAAHRKRVASRNVLCDFELSWNDVLRVMHVV